MLPVCLLIQSATECYVTHDTFGLDRYHLIPITLSLHLSHSSQFIHEVILNIYRIKTTIYDTIYELNIYGVRSRTKFRYCEVSRFL
jgi:hypothetical protein